MALDIVPGDLRSFHDQLPAPRVRAHDAPEPQVGALELLAQRHNDMARLQCAGRGTRQQRREQEEVDVTDERHPGVVRRQQSLQGAGGVETSEAAAGDHHVPGHARTLETIRGRGQRHKHPRG
jgi:hypothetical protein